MGSRQATDTKVAKEALQSIEKFARELNVDLEELFVGVEHLLQEPTATWNELAIIYDNIGRLAATDEELVRIGGPLVKESSVAVIARSASLFVDPNSLLLNAPHATTTRIFPLLNVETSNEESHVRIRHWLPETARPSRAFFVICAGVYEYITTTIGLAKSDVLWTADGHSGTYRVYPPPSQTLWARIRATTRVLINSQATIAEFQRNQVDIAARQAALEAVLSERAEALDERERALAAEQRALEIRDRFLQTMGHELRTPFNGLVHTTKALRSPEPDDDRNQLLQAMTDSSLRLCTILDSILTFAKLTSGDVAWLPSVHRLTDLADTIAASVSDIAQEKNIQIHTHLTTPGWWELDMAQLTRIGRELAKNAIEHSPSHSDVHFRFGIQQSRLCMEFEDQGPGIEEKDLQRVFEPFCQLETKHVRRTRGSGLGLSIVKATCEGIGGSVYLEPLPKEGLRVYVEIPTSAAESPVKQSTGRLVLIVDDDRINRLVAQRLLKKLACCVEMAEDGKIAVEKVLSKNFDLVLMDCEMPNLDGWAATRVLRSQGLRIPIVAATAYAGEQDRRRCWEAGMNDFLAKPLSAQLLESVIEKWLGPPPK